MWLLFSVSAGFAGGAISIYAVAEWLVELEEMKKMANWLVARHLLPVFELCY